jgi:hypothetical protein
MPEKVQLVLSDEALSIIADNATARKRGDFVGRVLVDYNRIMSGTGDLGDEDSGILERIDNRLARIEKQLAVLIASKSS